MLPVAFLDRMKDMLGSDFHAFEESFSKDKYQALRMNALKQNIDGSFATDGAEKVMAQVARLFPVPWSENGYYYEKEDQPGKHPFHEAGVYYIQEPSAQSVVELLEVTPGERVLDLCAAPGGKSTQIGAKLRGKGFLLCNEYVANRAKILSENIERMGIGNACVTNESPDKLAEMFPGYFDKILVDAPCSGEGMFRKNEVASEEWSPENVELCARRQAQILDAAAGMLCPGGRLVYSTCTFAPAENEESIRSFLQRHTEFKLVSVNKEKIPTDDCHGFGDMSGTLRLWPHRVKGEGHFAAVMEKVGDRAQRRNPVNGFAKGISEKEVFAFGEFCRENLKIKGMDSLGEAVGLQGPLQYMTFGDNLYAVSVELPALKGMKVLRPGLHLGELKKNRFEPSHALALAIRPSFAKYVWNMDAESAEARAYINGQTFPAEGEKGWYLICADGFGLGWGKLAGGMMKNHYPKGLRK